MRISRSSTSFTIGFPVPLLLKVSFKLLQLLLMCCIQSAYASPDSTSNAPSPDIHTQHTNLCLKYDRGNDFLYTMHSRNDGCYLECVILTSSRDKVISENNFLTESRSLPHYLTGHCRDKDHSCDRGLCIDHSMLKPISGPDFANLTISISRVLLSATRKDADDDSLPDPFVKIFVDDQNFSTKTYYENREPHFYESFSVGNVSAETQITFVVYDDDSVYFHNVIDSYVTTAATVVRNGWNGQVHFYTMNPSDNTEGILANITFA